MRITLLLLTLFFLSADSYAEVVWKTFAGKRTIEIRGKIRPEDLPTFKKMVGPLKRESEPYTPLIFLDSPGGDVMTALAIGNLMYENELIATVFTGASCGSACVFILGSSSGRLPIGKVIIHSPYSNSTDTSYAQAKVAFAEIERIAVSQFKRVGVSADLWNAMTRVPASELRELSVDELRSFGLQGIDPALADASGSAYAKRLGITKQELLRREAMSKKCMDDWWSTYPDVSDPLRFAKTLMRQQNYCNERAGLEPTYPTD